MFNYCIYLGSCREKYVFIYYVTGLNALSKQLLGIFWTQWYQSSYMTFKIGSENFKRHIHPIHAQAYVNLISPGNQTHMKYKSFQAKNKIFCKHQTICRYYLHMKKKKKVSVRHMIADCKDSFLFLLFPNCFYTMTFLRLTGQIPVRTDS